MNTIYTDSFDSWECAVLACHISDYKVYIECIETGEKGWCDAFLVENEESVFLDA